MVSSNVRLAFLLPLAGACGLLASGFNTAIGGIGPLGSLASVKLGAAVGATLGYFLVLCAASWVGRRSRGLVTTCRWIISAGLSVAAGAATLASPLIPSAMLAVACQYETTCPQWANPVLWFFLRLVTGLPAAPALVGMGVVIASAAWSRQRPVMANAG